MTNPNLQPPLIFALRRGKDFATRLARHLKTTLAPAQTLTFSDGNIYVQLQTSIRHREVILVQSLMGDQVDSDFLELAFYIDAAKRAGAVMITAVVPYFSYAKADKHDFPGTSLRARVLADTLQVAGVKRMMMLDLHNPSITGFFGVSVEHLSAHELIASALKKEKIKNLIVVSPDAGFAKNARHYSALLGRDCAVCDKNRPDHSERPQVLEIIGDVKGKNAVIVDDFTTSGGTLLQVTKELLHAGALSVSAAVSHAPISPAVLAKITASSLKQLLTTNSVPNLTSWQKQCPKLKVLDISPLFAQTY